LRPVARDRGTARSSRIREGGTDTAIGSEDGDTLRSLEPQRTLAEPVASQAPINALPLIGVAASVALLAVPAFEASLPFGGLAVLRTARDLLGFFTRVAAWAALEVLWTVPLGFLAVLVFRDRARRRERVLLVTLPAAALAFAGTALAGWLSAQLSHRAAVALPGLALGLAGAMLGLGAGMAWRRGRSACARFALQIVGTCVVLGAVAAVVGALAIDAEPRTTASAPITSAEKRRLFELLRSNDPRDVPDGETRTLHLSVADLDRLSAWASAATGRGHGKFHIEGPDTASAEASIRLPWPRGRWLNVATRVHVKVEADRFDLVIRALRVGGITLPERWLAVLTPMLVAELRNDPRIDGTLATLHHLRIDADGVTATWGRLDLPTGSLAALVWGTNAADVRAHVGAYIGALVEAVARAPAGDGRFVVAHETAFALARERSRGRSAVEENRAAIVALGIVLGHERISGVVGDPLDARYAEALSALRRTTTVRSRKDWVRHFTVSAALVALSWNASSDAAGIFKEERDAGGGSGFSFGDLLADRAGTTFADVATRDESSAAALQERLAGGIEVEDLFPPAADLPEDIRDEDLQSRYGGVGGPLFVRYAQEIERRVASCAAYR
jgi:hypothetical protein